MSVKELIRLAYFRERRRIQSTIRRYVKRGLSVNLVLPKIPKVITSGSVRRLERITLSKIRDASKGPDFETGEVLDYGRYVRQRNSYMREQRAQEKRWKESPSTNIPQEWEISLFTYRTELQDYDERARSMVEEAIDVRISQYGEKAVGEAIARMKEAGELMTAKESYNIGAVLNMLSLFGSILQGSEEEWRKRQQLADDLGFNEDDEWFE